MNGIRFYLEYEKYSDKKKATVKNLGKHKGVVIAVLINHWKIHSNGHCFYDCFAGCFDTPNSLVCSQTVQEDYLRTNCKRIPEVIAREIHPKLFYALDNNKGI